MNARSLPGAVLGSLVYFPSREILQSPAAAGLAFEDLSFESADGVRLRGWWLPTSVPERRLGRIVFCHDNGGNIGDRLLEARALTAAGFDLLLFDYRGYGRSGGRPDEQGTYRDARAARQAVPAGEPAPIVYIGESLGGAVALRLAIEQPPSGLILQSTFTSLREVARHHYAVLPGAMIPNWYPSAELIASLRAPLLVLHGDRDEIVPFAHGQSLYEAAPEPKRMHVFAGRGHNDLVLLSATEYAAVIAEWAAELPVPTG
jgi:fermentation-respiration switch protein FrsA (DUF1100 family)